MAWTASVPTPKKLECRIELDEAVGYYLYVYENGKDVYDGLQDTLQFAMEEAYERFNIPLDLWRQVE